MLTTESALVQIWARNVKTEEYPNRKYTRDQVPNVFNLREMVFKVLDGVE